MVPGLGSDHSESICLFPIFSVVSQSICSTKCGRGLHVRSCDSSLNFCCIMPLTVPSEVVGKTVVTGEHNFLYIVLLVPPFVLLPCMTA